MQFNRFTWLDRVGQHLNRRILTKLDGTAETVDVTRGDDNILVDGTPFAAETMNGLENRIAAAFEEGNNQFQQVGAGIADLNADVKEIYEGGNRANYIENRCLLDNGDVIIAAGYAMTPELTLPEGGARSFMWGCNTHANVEGSGHNMALIVYNASRAVVATYTSKTTNYVDLPANAAVIVASFYIPDAAENNIMLQVGTEPPYEFYRAKNEKVDGLVGLGIKSESAFATASGAFHQVNVVSANLGEVEQQVQQNITDINSIQSELTKTTGAVTVDTSNFTGNVGAVKYGSIVFLTFSLSGAKAMTAGSLYKVGTVPTSFRPSAMQFGVMLYNATLGGRIYIEPSGNIQFNSAQNATFGNGLRATVVYLI